MALQTIKTRVPETITGIAKMMEMDTAEIRAWPCLSEVRTAIKDYNIRYITKQQLLSRLNDIAVKNSADELVHYAEGIENLRQSVKISY